jgi:molybdenum ABC transporter molybdate-binding protein
MYCTLRTRRALRGILGMCLAAIMLAGIVSACGGSNGPSSEASGTDSAGTLTAYVAANMSTVFPALVKSFNAAEHTKIKVKADYAGTQILLTQMEAGALADLFVSADLPHMRQAKSKGLVSSYHAISSIEPVVIVPKSNPAHITSLRDLENTGVTLVIGVPNVPIGEYARQILKKANAGYGSSFDATVLKRVVATETDTSQVAQAVAINQADAGICYRTDVNASIAGKVRIINVPPAYEVLGTNFAAVPTASDQRELATKFMDYILSSAGQRVMRNYNYAPAP